MVRITIRMQSDIQFYRNFRVYKSVARVARECVCTSFSNAFISKSIYLRFKLIILSRFIDVHPMPQQSQ